MKTLKISAVLLAFATIAQTAAAQHHHDDPELHVGPRWSECSFQIDPSLTQEAWHEFTSEAGLVAYFRPLTDARAMGKRNFEISILQWQTKFDETKPAWNDTFIHPDSAHWLKEGDRLSFPGLTARYGITDKLDAAVYFTKNPGANYGFAGGQLQYNVFTDADRRWSVAARASGNSIFGPEDLKLSVYGLDALVSREFKLYSDWASIAPYVGVSTYMTHAHETTNAVSLRDERVFGTQTMVGTVLKLSVTRLAVEYNFAKVSTFSFKLGVAF